MILEVSIDPEKKLAIKVGEKVNFTTPLYKNKEKSEERIEVAALLSIHPKKIFHHLKKKNIVLVLCLCEGGEDELFLLLDVDARLDINF